MNYEKLMSKKNSDGKDAVDFLNEASELIDKKNFNTASGLLTEGIQLCGHPRLFFNRGYCYYQMKEYKNAVKDFNKSISNDRGNDLLKHERQRLFLYLGIVHEEIEEDDQAIEAYKKAADWGYEGAVARLEKMGVTYLPQKINNNEDETEEPVHKSKLQQKKRSQVLSESNAELTKNIKINKNVKKKSKLRFILPVFAGFILGAGFFFFFQDLSEKSKIKTAAAPPVITAVVKTENIYLLADPFVHADIIKILYYGDIVEISGDASGGFTPVFYDGYKGWVSSDSIEKNQ